MYHTKNRWGTIDGEQCILETTYDEQCTTATTDDEQCIMETTNDGK